MGSGKSTIAKKLSNKLQMPLHDTDADIESSEGKIIADIFKDYGEKYFRDLECTFIQNTLDAEPSVISLGGGSVLNPKNLELLLEKSFVVYLKFKPEVLTKRLIESKQKYPNKRPILSEISDDELCAFVEKHLADREDIYQKAHLILDNVMDINERLNLLAEAYRNYIK